MKLHIKADAGELFVLALTLIFIAFRLAGIIDWPWYWILSPLWIIGGIVFLTIGIVLIPGVIIILIDTINEWRRKHANKD